MLHFARQVPSVPVQRRMNLARAAAARAKAVQRPSWCSIFTKAFALVAHDRPELRRSYLAFPWPHLYEHAASVATVTVERRYGDEDAVFFVQMQKPDQFSSAQIDARLRHCKKDPVRSVGRRSAASCRSASCPGRSAGSSGGPVCIAWVGSAPTLFGTYGVTVYAGLGAASLHPLSVLTTTLNYGVIEPDGSVEVRAWSTTTARSTARRWRGRWRNWKPFSTDPSSRN